MRSDRERLLDIAEAIVRIEKYAAQGQERFVNDELVQVWVVRHLQVIGEACRTMSEGFKEAHPEIPWFQIAGMRNILVHEYFDIDQDIVWAVVAKDLPPLRAQIEGLLQ